MTTPQKILVAAIVAFACTACVSTYVLRQVKARSLARVAVNAPRPVTDGAADSSSRAAQIKEAPQILAPNETRLHHRIDDVSFTLSNGKISRLSDYSGRAIVIAFTSPTCPVALRYRPRLTELADRFKGKVEFLIINSRADSNAALIAALAASSTTEAFFLDSARTLLYHGAVDDQYGLGYQLDAPRRTFLIDAIDSFLASKPIATPATTAPGCVIEGKTEPQPSPVTFHNRISRILQYNCQECHRPGEPAPFNLLTYDDAKSHAKTIKRVVERKTMPPWFAEGGHWANDRRLSDADCNDLLAWIDAGSPEGDPAHAPLARNWETGWRIGKPDAIFEVSRPIKVRAQGAMPYQEVVVATGLPEDKWVKAVEIRSTQPQVTHHILVFEIYPPDHPRDTNSRPKYIAGLSGYFAGMVPGQGHIVFPENTAKLLPKGAGLRFQIHYTPNGTACEDKPKIGLLYADAPPKYEILTRSVNTTEFLIPANASNHMVTATKTFTEPTRLFSFNPHSHVRGKAFKYELVMPDGARTTLLDLPHYDFNWQIDYRLKEPLDVPIRSKLVVTGWYDNSKDNPANPDPDKDVRFGDQTWDEMMIGYYTRHSLAPTRVDPTQIAAAAAAPVADEGAGSETGILKTPDGKPLPDADVYFSTASTAVPIYSTPPPKVAVARTGADGRFSFPLDPKNRAIIVMHEKGYGQITVAELVKGHELTLQPWGRVEGTLREGSKPLAGKPFTSPARPSDRSLTERLSEPTTIPPPRPMPPDITSFLGWRLAMRGFLGSQIAAASPAPNMTFKPDMLTFSPANHSSQTLAVADGPSLAVRSWQRVIPRLDTSARCTRKQMKCTVPPTGPNFLLKRRAR